MNLPLLSVIIPVFNAEKFISDALQNVLAQGINNLEVICVDDGSTDRSAQIIQSVEDAGIRYFYQANAGAASARNYGLRQAKGQFITFLDADDLYPPGKLRRQIDFLLNNPTIEGIWGHSKFEYATDLNERMFRVNEDEAVWSILLGASMFRKEIFEKIGPFNEQMILGEDTEWYLRLRDFGLNVFIDPHLSLVYRPHADGLVHREQPRLNSALLKALHQSIQRRKDTQK
ncbi:glycosyltransferase family 2 protein [Runella sp.]|uniref:glycosyltransferase family 2 protein n=1 Tax=Runella sp. TaxID=1960881 RepID=UPI003D0DC67B